MDEDDFDENQEQEQGMQEQMQNAAQNTVQAAKKSKEMARAAARAPGVAMRTAGKALEATGKAVELTGKGIQIVGKALQSTGKVLKKVGKITYNAGKSTFEAGKALCSTGIGAIAGVPLCILGIIGMIAGKATEFLGIALDKIGKLLEKLGKLIEKLGRAIAKAGQKLTEAGNKAIQAANAATGGGGSAGGGGGGSSGDNSDDGESTGGIPSLSSIFGGKGKKILFAIAAVIIIIIVLVIGTKESTVEDGEYKEGDLSNVPYVVSSMVIDNLVIVNDSTNNYTYAFKNEEGEYVTLDDAIDEAFKTLKENKSTSIDYLGENESDNKKKELLKKMIQAEIATQFPDLTLNEDLGLGNVAAVTYNGSENDYCVDMTSPNALPACSEAQLKEIVNKSSMGDKAKSNMLSAIPDVVKYQSQYNVNAVFFMAAVRCESGWGTGWDLIDPSTYNWCSIKGSANGGYIDRNGTSWNKYSSFGEASEGFFKLISSSDGYYFGSGKYTVQTIAPTYCNAGWGTKVAGYVEEFYGLIGITPNIATSPTASGGEGSASAGQGVANNSNASTTVNNGNFLESVKKVKKIVADGGYSYGHSDPRKTKQINCATFVQWCLLEAGFNVEKNGRLLTFAWDSDPISKELGFQVVYTGKTLSYEEAGAQAGDIILEGSDYSKAGASHTLIYGGKNEAGQNIVYDCGSDKKINEQPGESIGNPYGSDHYIVAVYRPSGGSSSSSSFVSSTGDVDIDYEIDQDKNTQGGIKIQRKDKEGNTSDLKYTSTKNFNALVSTNDPRALEFYTLVKTSGSSNSTNLGSSNMQTDGTMEGNAAAIYSFFVSKGVTKEGAAGMLGNMMHESGFMPNNLENTRNSSWGITDEEFTAKVDSGTIDRTNFLNYQGRGEYGYGIVQWTSSGIKGELYDYAESQGTSIADLGMQCEVLYQQLSTKAYYSKLWSVLTTTTSVDAAADAFLEEYERPAHYNYTDRRNGAQEWYGKLANSTSVPASSNTSSTTNTSTSGGTTSSTSGSTSGSSVVKSLDNFLFIGDSRYEGIESKLSALGNNVTAIGVGSSMPKNWIEPVKNGGGIVYKGNTTSSSKNIGQLPTTVSGVSVMLGVNGVNAPNQISDMQELLNTLHDKYPSAPIMVNSVYHLGPAYGSGTNSMNTGVNRFNQAMKDFCNQNTWAYYIDVNQNLDDAQGYLKSEYSGDGLHISGSEGVSTLVNNIKNGLLNSGATSTSTVESGSTRPGYSIVVANRTDTEVVVTDSYSYDHSFTVEKSNGHTQPTSQVSSTPGDQVVKSTTTTTYSSQNADYQAALQNFTLYFDFLWAVLVDSHDTKLVEKWAELVCNNIGDDSKVTITVYSDESTSSSTSSESKGTYAKVTSTQEDPIATYDIYNVIETTNTTVYKLTSKACVTNADTWLINYKNEAETYAKFKSKSEEKILEKTNTESKDTNIIKILNKYKTSLEILTKEEYIVDEMLEENEKVSFMIDVFSYVLDRANGKDKQKIDIQLDSILDTTLFDLSKTEEIKTTRVLLYDSININDDTLQKLYRAVESICGSSGDEEELLKRKKYVTSVILNRTMSSKFPDTVEDVLKQRYQFENYNPRVLNQNITISDSTKEAVDHVVVAGDCAKHSVYFAKPSTGEKNGWEKKYKFTFNDGDKTDNSFNYYTTEEIDKELCKYEITVKGKLTRPSLKGRKIIRWAKGQIAQKSFYNNYEKKNMNSNNSSLEFVKSAYYAGEMEYISGDIPCPNEIEYYDDGTVDYSKIPETAVIVANNGIVSLYIGNGYVIEAGGEKIQKVPIDQSLGAGHFKGWGFAANDQDAAREELVVVVGSGMYGEGWTPLDDYSEGYSGVYTCGDKSYKTFMQGGQAPWASVPFSESGSYAAAACGVTSVTIILSGYGVDVTPVDVGTYAYSVVGAPVGSTTTAVTGYHALTECFKHWGIQDQSGFISPNREDIVYHLQKGKPVMLLVRGNYGPYTTNGHYITLLGYDELNDKVMLGDPAGGGRYSGWWDLDKIYPAVASVNYIND